MAAKTISQHRELIGQLVRYALTGGLASIFNIGVYWILRDRGGLDPNLAWTVGFVSACWSVCGPQPLELRGHGRRDNLARTGGASSSFR
jgi:hypothetical protein